VDEAVATARAAQPKCWAAGIQKRHAVLMSNATELVARASKIGAPLSCEQDNPYAEGNAVVWKPANLTPASDVALAEIIASADTPAATFTLVIGPGCGRPSCR